MQGWVTGRGSGASRGGRGQQHRGRPESWESLSHRKPVFVYVAQPSYLPPVLTPRSSCFKSLLLIFLFTLASAPPGPVVFGVLVLFQWRLRGGGDTGGGGGGGGVFTVRQATSADALCRPVALDMCFVYTGVLRELHAKSSSCVCVCASFPLHTRVNIR